MFGFIEAISVWLLIGAFSFAFRFVGRMVDNQASDQRQKETARVMAFDATLRAVDRGVIRLPRVY